MIDDQISGFESVDEISRRIAEIDLLLGLQLDAILHHPEFKTLEAAWRGVFYLVNQIEYSRYVKIRIFHAGKQELLKDFEQAVELENSIFYQKIFSDVYVVGSREFPFGLLIGAYEFDHLSQDVFVLEKMAEIAALAHAPFIAGASPSMFDWESFEAVDGTRDMSRHGSLPQYERWNSFRRTETARFAGLCLPHVLLREPYKIDKDFTYRETSEKRDLLWGNAAFAFAGCVARAYDEKSWLGKMGSLNSDGAVEDLPVRVDEQDVVFSLDADLRNHLPEISDLGFMSLIDDAGGRPYFFDSRSTNKPPLYDTESSMRWSKKCAKIENILAMSRFVVYVMSYRRDNFYRFEGRLGWEMALNRWLHTYYHEYDSAPDEVKAERPLRECRMNVTEVPPYEPYDYRGVLFIHPRYLIEEWEIAMRAVMCFFDLGKSKS